MKDFPLIKSLEAVDERTPLPKGHKYTKHTVIVEGKSIIANIPERETEKFEAFIKDCGGEADKYSFNKIMHDLRGIRG